VELVIQYGNSCSYIAQIAMLQHVTFTYRNCAARKTVIGRPGRTMSL